MNKKAGNTILKNDQTFFILAAAVAATVSWLPLINSICCIALFVFWLFTIRLKPNFSQTSHLFLFSALFLFTAISYFYSANTREAWTIIQLKLPLIAFPLVFSGSKKMDTTRSRLILFSFTYSFSIISLIIIIKSLHLYFQTADAAAMFGYHVIPFTFLSPAVVALFSVFCLAVHMNELVTDKKLTFLNVVPLFFCFCVLLFISNRMGIFLGSCVIVFFVMRMFSSLRIRLLVIVSLVLFIVVLLFFNKPLRIRFATIVQFNSAKMVPLDTDGSLGKSWDGFYLRIALWKCAGTIIENNFWTGVGVGDVQDELQKSYEKRKFYFASRYNRYDAHNQFIEQWLINGVVGVLLLTVCFFVPLFAALRSGNWMYLAFLVVFIVFCLTESMLEISKGAVWYSLFNSIFAFSGHSLNRKKND